MENPYRTPPPMPIEISGGTLAVAIDALIVSLRFVGVGFTFSKEERNKAANDLLDILAKTTYTVTRIDEEAQEKAE